MRQQQHIMGMPVIIDIPGLHTRQAFDQIFDFFRQIDAQFSAYRPTSEVSRWNSGRLRRVEISREFRTVLDLSAETKTLSHGYFDIFRDGRCDPSGLVKGWAIHRAANLIRSLGLDDFYVEAGGDIEVGSGADLGHPWRIGIRHPVQPDTIVKVVELRNQGIATSGTYERGRHIYSPFTGQAVNHDIVSLTVIGPNIYEADRFATAAFAMGEYGLTFIHRRPELEGYMIDRHGRATMTPGFEKFVTAS